MSRVAVPYSIMASSVRVAAVLAVAAAVAAVDPWPMAGQNPQHSCVSSAVGPTGACDCGCVDGLASAGKSGV